MKRLTIFPINTVIRFSESDVRQLLLQTLSSHLKIEIDSDPAPELSNHQAILEHLCEVNGIVLPDEAAQEQIRKDLKKAVKKLYLADEDAFEVRPGVQSLFNHFEKEKGWKYGIISDYWNDTTQFIMQSCGVSSKNKLTVCAESANSAKAQIDILIDRRSKGSQVKVHLVCLSKDCSFQKESFKLIRPKASNKESNYYVYPKFSELFKTKKRKSKKGKSSS